MTFLGNRRRCFFSGKFKIMETALVSLPLWPCSIVDCRPFHPEKRQLHRDACNRSLCTGLHPHRLLVSFKERIGSLTKSPPFIRYSFVLYILVSWNLIHEWWSSENYFQVLWASRKIHPKNTWPKRPFTFAKIHRKNSLQNIKNMLLALLIYCVHYKLNYIQVGLTYFWCNYNH